MSLGSVVCGRCRKLDGKVWRGSFYCYLIDCVWIAKIRISQTALLSNIHSWLQIDYLYSSDTLPYDGSVLRC